MEQTTTRDDRGTLARVTDAVYWFVLIGLSLAVCCAPTIVLWLLLAQDASNLPLYAVGLLPVAPAVSAALWAWRSRERDPDTVPVARFLRGYRLNLVDSLRVAVPAAALLGILSINVTYGDAVRTSSLNIAFVVLGLAVLLLAVRALSISSALSFRYRDVLRLSVFTLLTMPLRTLSLVSLGVLVVGLSLFVGDYAVVLLASVLTFFLHLSERPVLERLTEQFVAADA
ncbi:hypothetical protein V1260_05295 [Brachybacterium sp. J144]|uniref:hypothetical protein n=1 Tax=Brachybacterium sp. J144 TaxID=3116487 RepID=UPI002E75D03E|nr:hypothetical protein [Brachybacterium sp. J144]MEE1650202.1 hypothetical protein [Brachybacterium sp. J144]